MYSQNADVSEFKIISFEISEVLNINAVINGWSTVHAEIAAKMEKHLTLERPDRNADIEDYNPF